MNLTRRKYHLWTNYRITVEQYDTMFTRQKGVCALCHRPPKSRRLDVDHCHKTGRVRGLLCWWCNKKLAIARHTPEVLRRAVKYLTSKFDGRLI